CALWGSSFTENRSLGRSPSLCARGRISGRRTSWERTDLSPGLPERLPPGLAPRSPGRAFLRSPSGRRDLGCLLYWALNTAEIFGFFLGRSRPSPAAGRFSFPFPSD